MAEATTRADDAAPLVPPRRLRPDGREVSYIEQAISNGAPSGDGGFTELATKLIRQSTGAEFALPTNSRAGALDRCGTLLDPEPGVGGVVPSSAFPSVATVCVPLGAAPVFADYRPDTLDLDEPLVEAAVTAPTRGHDTRTGRAWTRHGLEAARTFVTAHLVHSDVLEAAAAGTTWSRR